MKADVLLLAAGFGKRLNPLTLVKPKPLVEVGGRPLIDRNLELIARSGAERVIINLHYLGEQIEQYVGDGARWGLEVVYSREPVLLDTGGAIKQIEPLLLYDVLLTVNSDIVLGEDFSLTSVYRAHCEHSNRPCATVVLRADPLSESYGEVGVDPTGRVTSFLGVDYLPTSERLMYLGVQALSKEVLLAMPPRGTVFSVTRTTWVSLLEQGHLISSHRYDGYWNDVGTHDRLEQAERDFSLSRDRC